MRYEFTTAKIDHWEQKVGVDVRPPIEIGLEQQRFTDFSREARATYPQLFDRMVLGDRRFEMLKTLEYPGKGRFDIRTFSMTPRGPMFAVPRQVSQFGVEPELPNINDAFVRCMRLFLQKFPTQKVVRVGKINEYVFDCGQINSLELVRDRFLRVTVPGDGEIFVRFNLPTPEFNRVFVITPVTAQRVEAPYTPPKFAGFGVKIAIDVNHRNLQKEKDEAEWQTVLQTADLFNEKELYAVLNNPGEELQ
jgi:hypothetical protein